jgi:7,8-dihydropterin-6-yl-methyl-4-(beta-D-ribofuranosyl)aminobenzene 5'-phosphate synthase
MLDVEKIRITTLSENSVADIDYIAEWGFSVHIAIDGGPTLLFDTGNGLACTFNAEVAGIRLSDIDMIVLSHGHTDHTGGLRAVLQKIRKERPERDHVDIFCHPAAIASQHVKHTDRYFYRGCPHNFEELLRLGARFRTASEPVWISEEIATSGEIPMVTDFETVAPICFLKKADGYVESPVADDQALFILTDRGLIIILGCAHRGMINTITHAKNITGIETVYLVIGGTHLLNTSMDQQVSTLSALEELGVKKLGVSHCTGMRPAGFFYEKLGSKRFFFNNAGTSITFNEESLSVSAFEIYDV